MYYANLELLQLAKTLSYMIFIKKNLKGKICAEHNLKNKG